MVYPNTLHDITQYINLMYKKLIPVALKQINRKKATITYNAVASIFHLHTAD